MSWTAAYCIGLLLISTACLAQRAMTVPDAKAHYVFEAIKHLKWPNEAQIDPFVVGVVGDDPAMSEALNRRKLTATRKIRFLIETFNNQDFSDGRYSVLFISSKSIKLNTILFSKAKNTLIISDGKVDRSRQMISLITIARRIKLQLNRENLISRGFFVSTNLLEIGGTKGELGDQLRDEQTRLNKLIAQVEEKETSLNRLKITLKEDSLLLEAARGLLEKNKTVMAESERKLVTLSSQISTAKEAVNKYKEDIESQQVLIREKQLEMTSHETAMKDLRSGIHENMEILALQQSKIDLQTSLIEIKNETIIEQRSWIVVSILISVVFVIMIYFLVRLNNLRRQSSRDLKIKNSQLFTLATTDDMTNLFNRRHFLEMTKTELERQQRQSSNSVLLMIDIDNFKSINDRYGHSMGDEAIRVIAAVFKKSLRTYDLVGRMGGEEFAMMLVNCDIELATGIANRLCESVASTPINLDDLEISQTVSIGLSLIYMDDRSIEQVLHRADKALYLAKEGGRNRVVVYSA